jgi:hypothetical protein
MDAQIADEDGISDNEDECPNVKEHYPIKVVQILISMVMVCQISQTIVQIKLG